jgi:hypothetical protein
VIAIVTPTIMDGQVIRWYVGKNAAENGDEMLSASRNGIRVFVYLDDVPDEVMRQAKAAYDTLRRGGDVRHLATHRMGLFSRVLEPLGAAAG